MGVSHGQGERPFGPLKMVEMVEISRFQGLTFTISGLFSLMDIRFCSLLLEFWDLMEIILRILI